MTAGYSGTPQLKKLGIVPGARWSLIGEPAGWSFDSTDGASPPDAAARVSEGAATDILIAFVTEASQLAAVFLAAEPLIHPAGALWIAWPRRAAGHVSDVTDGVVREAGLRGNLVDTKVAAIDIDWSGLKFVWRRENR